jgi:hypothetical protein
MEEKHLVSNRTNKFTWLENKSKCINNKKKHNSSALLLKTKGNGVPEHEIRLLIKLETKAGKSECIYK